MTKIGQIIEHMKVFAVCDYEAKINYWVCHSEDNCTD